MQVFKINEMRWADIDQTTVRLVADTNTGNGEVIYTPYSADSIIWDAVRAYPADQILQMLPPEPSVSDAQDVTDVIPRTVQ